MNDRITITIPRHDRITITDSKQPQIQSVKVVGATNFGASGPQNLAELNDVNASDPDNNETVVYDSVSGKYVIKVLPIIDGGTF